MTVKNVTVIVGEFPVVEGVGTGDAKMCLVIIGRFGYVECTVFHKQKTGAKEP